jgi:hypothetical protein
LILFYRAARSEEAFFCLDTKETKNASPVRPSASGQWPPDKKLKTTSQKRALAEPFALQAHF